MSSGKKWRVKDLAAAKRRRRSAKLQSRNEYKHREKNWKHVYTRSAKVTRARQLGFDYPKRTDRQLLDEHLESDE